MKRIIALLVVGGLLLTVSTGAFGALHNSRGDFRDFNNLPYTASFTARNVNIPSWGGWYYVGPETPYLIGDVNVRNDFEIAGLYYHNDFTFAEAGMYNYREDNRTTYLRGSYQFSNGVFLGLGHLGYSWFAGSYSDELASIGYAYTLGKKGYIALSADFYAYHSNVFPTDSNRGQAGYDLDFRYYTDDYRVYGQFYAAVANVDTAFLYYNAGLSYQLGINYDLKNQWVIGLEAGGEPDNYTYETAGATWSPKCMELNLRYTRFHEPGDIWIKTEVLGMYSINEKFSLGGYYANFDADPTYSLLAKYELDKKNNLRFSYELGTVANDHNASISLAYYKNL